MSLIEKAPDTDRGPCPACAAIQHMIRPDEAYVAGISIGTRLEAHGHDVSWLCPRHQALLARYEMTARVLIDSAAAEGS